MSRQRGAWTFGPIIGTIIVILAVIGFFAVCTDDNEDVNGLARVELAGHEYECWDEYDCGYYNDRRGDGYYEDERGSRNGRDKKTCFAGCDNVIIIPELPGGIGGGGEEGGHRR